jgi:hypothetical protein
MFTDLCGKRRLKINLHTHTTLSDGKKPPEEVAAIYRTAGYDAIAITDHWIFTTNGNIGGLDIISGCEYHVYAPEKEGGIYECYHILALGCEREPDFPRSFLGDESTGVRTRAKKIIDAIHEAKGVAVLAHPAWSLNSAEQMMAVAGYDATEIYNSVSEHEMSDRPYSGILVDEAASLGLKATLLATDDAHYYTGDECRGFIAVDADSAEKYGLIEAIRRGDFYASTGPEIHLERVSEKEVKLVCSPAVKVVFLSNSVWADGRVVRGREITSASYTAMSHETFLRAEVTDESGRVAFSNIIYLK